MRVCRGCGCDDLHACVDELGTPCAWVEPDLCSACAAEYSWMANLIWSMRAMGEL